MPELPEVETTRRGISPHVIGKTVTKLNVRNGNLRWPVDPRLPAMVRGARIVDVGRRAKYLLIRLTGGTMLVHLGMSGSLRLTAVSVPPATHDHIDVELDDGMALRFNDPRRFGSFHFTADADRHPLLASLGPEPLGDAFDGGHLARAARGRRCAIKTLLMNAGVVVGVGNIYANEALFRAGIHPARAAGRISRARFDRLADCVRAVLGEAIAAGGTTLRDFVGGDGKPGYFRQSLAVYERAGEPCRHCGTAIKRRVLGQRATYYCPACQR